MQPARARVFAAGAERRIERQKVLLGRVVLDRKRRQPAIIEQVLRALFRAAPPRTNRRIY